MLEADLVHLFDAIAERNGLACKICDPLSNGRSYGNAPGDEEPLALIVNFAPEHRALYYAIQTPRTEQKSRDSNLAEDVHWDVLQTLRENFPNITFAPGERPVVTPAIIHVSKAAGTGSYRESENQRTYQRALDIVQKAAADFGLTQAHRGMYYVGKLLGPSPYDRELTVGVALGDAPLISIQADRRSDEYADVQRQLTQEIEMQLRLAFGAKRVSHR